MSLKLILKNTEMSRKEKASWWLVEQVMKAKEIVRQFPEIFGLPLVLVSFYYSPHLLYMVDPTAAIWDWGVVQTVVLVAIIGLALNCLAYIGFKLNHPNLYKTFLELDYTKLPVWQITLLSFFVVSKYILMFLLITLALLT
jgi:magnesium-transporting ATPase (P-type)